MLQEPRAQLVHKGLPVLLVSPVLPVLKDLQASQDRQGLKDNKAVLVLQALLDHRAHRVPLVLLA